MDVWLGSAVLEEEAEGPGPVCWLELIEELVAGADLQRLHPCLGRWCCELFHELLERAFGCFLCVVGPAPFGGHDFGALGSKGRARRGEVLHGRFSGRCLLLRLQLVVPRRVLRHLLLDDLQHFGRDAVLREGLCSLAHLVLLQVDEV